MTCCPDTIVAPLGRAKFQPARSRPRAAASLSQGDGHLHLVLAAVEGDLDLVASVVLVHDMGDVILVLDVLIVDADDEVAPEHDGSVAEVGFLRAAAEAGALGRTTGN